MEEKLLREKIRNLISENVDELIEDMKQWNASLEEAKGVSYEVENEVKNIVYDLQNYVNSFNIDYSKNNFQIKHLEVIHEVFGVKINFKINFYFFKNNDVYVQNEGNTTRLYKYVPSSKTVYISVYVIGKRIVKNTFNSKIAHEIRHAHQYKKTGKNNTELLHPVKYYQIVKDIQKEGFPQIIAHIKYLSSKYEQEAYSEELYNELMYSDEPPESYFRKTNPYLAYNMLKTCVKVLGTNKNNQELIEALSKWGYNYDDFLRKAHYAQQSFIKRLSRVLVQVQEDKIDTNPQFNYKK